MGEAAFERPARPEEMASMRQLLREAMQAGAFGFSTTTSRNHTGYGARPLACRNASQEELAALCHACGTWAAARLKLPSTRPACTRSTMPTWRPSACSATKVVARSPGCRSLPGLGTRISSYPDGAETR